MRRLSAVGLLMSCARGAAPPPPTTPSAGPTLTVAATAMTVRFPSEVRPDSAWAAQRVPDRFAGPAWRVLIPVDTGTIVAHYTIHPDSALQLGAFADLAAAIRAGRLEACAQQSWILVCGANLRGTGAVDRGEVVVTITETRWLEALQHQRPPTAWLGILAPGRRWIWSDSVRVTYVDASERGGA